jgi:hypothetical protein
MLPIIGLLGGLVAGKLHLGSHRDVWESIGTLGSIGIPVVWRQGNPGKPW